MSKVRQYIAAVDEIKADKTLIEQTAKQMKKSHSNNQKNSKFSFYKYGVVLAVFLLFIITFARYPFIDKKDIGSIHLQESSGIIAAEYVQVPSKLDTPLMKEYIPSEYEIVTQSDAIIYGQVSDIQFIKVTMEENIVYYSLVSINVINSFKEDPLESKTVDFLTTSIIQSTTSDKATNILEQIQVNDKGFFMLRKFSNSDYKEYPNAKLAFKDLSQYGVISNKASAILEQGEYYIYPEWIYPSLPESPTYEDIETFIVNTLNK